MGTIVAVAGNQSQGGRARDESWDVADRFDEAYYKNYASDTDAPYVRPSPHWEAFFEGVADFIVAQLDPRTVLDAGCGVGFLVEALRRRGVDARGFDISEYAISQLPPALRPFCTLASITEEIEGHYDLITCIEVLEHVPRQLTDSALDNLAAHSDRLLFSSTPDGGSEPTHVNVRTPDEWVAAFARRGFLPQPLAALEIVSPQAMLLDRRRETAAHVAAQYEALRCRFARDRRAALRDLREREVDASRLRSEMSILAAALDESRSAASALERQLAEWERWSQRPPVAALARIVGSPPGDGGAPRRRRFSRLRRDQLSLGRLLARRAYEVFRYEGGPVEVARRTRQWMKTRPGVGTTQGAYSSEIERRYAVWRCRNELVGATPAERRPRIAAAKPLVSVVVPVFDPPVDVLRATLESVLAQTYEHFELCIANAGTDGSCRALIDELAERDHRVLVAHLGENRGISANSNAAVGLASGDYIALLDHDDLLASAALASIVEAVVDDPLVDVLYSDEDRLSFGGERVLPYLKPDWSPEFLHSYMWVGHLLVVRRSLLLRIGGFRSEYDGSQDYDLMLRLAANTDQIRHVPKVLYHWRMVEGSAAAGGKSDARRTNLAALDDAIRAAGRTARVAKYPFANRVVFSLVDRPLVSIVIPTDSATAIRSCLESIAARTTYDALEIVVVTNSELAASLETEFRRLPLRCVRFDELYNFSRKCNLGAAAAEGEYLLFLNDDVEPLTEGWIESMLQYAQLPEVGGVSGKLLYDDDTIQYAGLVTGVPGIVGTAFHTWARLDGSYHSMAICVRNTTSLTGACMLLRAKDFWAVGGWDELNTPISHSDLDLSFRLLDTGLRLVYTPFAELRHRGHESRRHATVDESLMIARIDRGADVYLIHRWPNRAGEDPFYTRGMRALLYEDESAYELHAPADLELPVEWWERPRVLLVGHELSSTGAPAMLVEVASALKRAGMLVVIAVAEGGPLVDECLAKRIPVVIDGAILQESERVSRFIAGFDVVGANTVLSWPVVHAARRVGRPCIWFVQESRFGVSEIQRAGPRARSAFKVADCIVFPSRSAADWYRAFDGVRYVVHYGIEDPSRVVSADPPFERLDGHLYVVHSGSVEARKGADILVDAVRRLSADVAERLHVLLVGRFLFDDYVESLRARARGLPSIVLVGEVSRATGLAYIANADVFVCTSRDESGPVVVLEAMALGRPVISTAVGVAAEVIRSGVNGVLVPVEDVEAVAQALERLLRDQEGRRRLGREARETYTSRLTEERYGREIVQIFGEALARADPRWNRDRAPAVAGRS